MSDSSQQSLRTVCFRTTDAAVRDDGNASFAFDMPDSVPRNKPVRVMLGSCELPMAQWTIEEAWDRIYFMEGMDRDEAGEVWSCDHHPSVTPSPAGVWVWNRLMSRR